MRWSDSSMEIGGKLPRHNVVVWSAGAWICKQFGVYKRWNKVDSGCWARASMGSMVANKGGKKFSCSYTFIEKIHIRWLYKFMYPIVVNGWNKKRKNKIHKFIFLSIFIESFGALIRFYSTKFLMFETNTERIWSFLKHFVWIFYVRKVFFFFYTVKVDTILTNFNFTLQP